MNNYIIKQLIENETIKTLLNYFNNDRKQIRLVGGCVRDALLGREVKDIDIAASIKIDKIINILDENQIKHENFAYKYGSVVVFINNQKFQITSLREDINQSGRHTGILYTNDWKKDAKRRDFTVNAIYLSEDSTLHDFYKGQHDLAKSKLKFIGDPDKRICEDYLRIYRYYRFLGIFKNPQTIDEYDSVIHKHLQDSFKHLSNDLLRKEILKMFETPFPINSFFYKNSNEKKSWVCHVKKHFIKSNYQIGLEKCLNKIDFLIK